MKPRTRLIATLGLLTMSLVAPPADAARRPVLSKDDRAAGMTRGVVAGRPGCPYSPKAKAALGEAMQLPEFEARVRGEYVDVSTEDGKAFAVAQHVHSYPLLIAFSPEGEEIWRCVAPDTNDEMCSTVAAIVAGRLSLREFERRLEQGDLSDEDAFKLASAYQRSDQAAKAEKIYRAVAGHPWSKENDLPRQASLAIGELHDGKERIAELERYLRLFPEDLAAALNLTISLLREENVPPDRRQLQLVATLSAFREAEDGYPVDFVLTAYRIARQFALYTDTRFAAWAIPYTERSLQLKPNEDVAADLATLCVLAGQESRLDERLRRFVGSSTDIEGLIRRARAEGHLKPNDSSDEFRHGTRQTE